MSAGSQLEIAISDIIFSINRAALSRAERGLNILRNTALEVLGKNGSGRRYGGHVASAPGEPPAPDKGNLRRNWSQRKIASPLGRGIRIRLKIRSQMFYATFLDLGTRKMSPRPFRKRIRDKAKPKIAALFSNL